MPDSCRACAAVALTPRCTDPHARCARQAHQACWAPEQVCSGEDVRTAGFARRAGRADGGSVTLPRHIDWGPRHIGLNTLAEVYGYALAGGYTVQAHHIVNRDSDDVDLFAPFDRAIGEMAQAAEQITTASSARAQRNEGEVGAVA
ncbi:hypothetical protein SAZ11_04460 [Streptomyces sp. FXJ1.4098]|nr:hypothetical protein [Streptomyces sp. FXJ1.4098]